MAGLGFAHQSEISTLTACAAQVNCDGAATLTAALAALGRAQTPHSFVVINKTGLSVTVTLPGTNGSFDIQSSEQSPLIPGSQTGVTVAGGGGAGNFVDVVVYYDGTVQA